MMIFNPQNGSPIKGAFAGQEVNIPVGKLCSVPDHVGIALKIRYPWLHEVVDSPNAAPNTPPPSAVVEEPDEDGATEDQIEVADESTEESITPSVEETLAIEDEEEQKQVIKDALDERGIKYDKRWGLKKLQEALTN